MKKFLKDLTRLWGILKPFHRYFYIQLGIIVISQGLVVAIAYGQSSILNFLVEKKYSLLLYTCILYASMYVLDIYVDYITQKNRIKHLDQSIFQYLQEYSYKRVLALTVEQHIEDHSALKVSIMNKGEFAIQTIVDKIVTTIIPTTSLAIFTIGVLFTKNLLLGSLSLVVILANVVWSFWFQKGHQPYVTKNRDNWNEQQRSRTETFTHLQMVKIMHREEFFIKRFLSKRLDTVRHHMLTMLRATKNSTRKNLFTEMSVIGTFFLSIYLYTTGAFEIGTIYLVLSLINRLFWSVSSLSYTVLDIPQYYADAEKYFEIVDKTPSFDENGNREISLQEDITFTDISFIYGKNEHPIFDALSFTIPKEKTTAFVGPSGSGKSTIVKLLLRAYDYKQGSIKIGETELKNIDAGYLREHIGYVEQHVDLLDDTIKENILLGVKEYERDEAETRLEEIAHKARLDQFYHRLGEKKFETVVGERGVKLSGGERQRVGIARAIIKNPEILIFDEATSSLDSANEKHVMDAINDVSKGKTTIIIAHRLSTVRKADKIIVMDKGHIAGVGTHDELMASSPIYQNLVAHQLS